MPIKRCLGGGPVLSGGECSRDRAAALSPMDRPLTATRLDTA